MITPRKRKESLSSYSWKKFKQENRSYVLIITDYPPSWDLESFESFLLDEGLVSEDIEFIQDCSQFWLQFSSEENADDFMKKLETLTVENKKLSIKKTLKIKGVTNYTELDDSWRNLSPYSWYNRHRWTTETDGLFGLKPQFLKSLGIIPPISCFVHVTNFDCDKQTLKELMDMAGHVELMYLPPGIETCAKIKYSHPLEAVQAVSMLNNQKFRGRKLSVIMQTDKSNTCVLPKGLMNIGPGLGIGNRPLKDVATQYERLQNNEVFNIKPNIFDCDIDTDNLYEPIDYKQALDLLRKMGIDPRDLLDALKWVKTKKPTVEFDTINIKDLPVIQTETEDNMKDNINSSLKDVSNSPASNDSTTNTSNKDDKKENDIKSLNGNEKNAYLESMSPVSIASSPADSLKTDRITENSIKERSVTDKTTTGMSDSSNQGEIKAESDENSKGRRDEKSNLNSVKEEFNVDKEQGSESNDMELDVPMDPVGTRGETDPIGLRFSNLPESVNFCVLYEKLSKIGPIMALNFTKPGCAEARFSESADAKTCLQQLNNTIIDGSTVAVNYTYCWDAIQK